MSIVIESPEVENLLREEAAKKGTTPVQVATDILAQHLAIPALPDPAPRPFYETATTEERLAAFNAWLDSHANDDSHANSSLPLSDYAISRESIYGEDTI